MKLAVILFFAVCILAKKKSDLKHLNAVVNRLVSYFFLVILSTWTSCDQAKGRRNKI